MNNLPPEDRKGVNILIALDGEVFSNRLRLKRAFRPLSALADRTYRDENGEIIVFPELDRPQGRPGALAVQPRCDGTTGPYRRVHTVPGKGQVLAKRLYIPGPSAIAIRQPSNEAPHIMLGGWGKNGGAVEGGFFYNTGAQNWSLFLRVEGRSPIPYPVRFRPDQMVTEMRFGAMAANQASITVHATTVNGDRIGVALWAADLPPEWGWYWTGDGMVLRRTTSIAQFTQNFRTGSYFRNTDWIETWLQGGGEYWHVWRANETGGACNWPDANRVQVMVRSPGSELVHIDLR